MLKTRPKQPLGSLLVGIMLSIAAVLGTAVICQLLFSSKKMSQSVVLNLVLNGDSKIGSAILVTFVS